MNKIKLTMMQLFITLFLLCGLMTIQTQAAPGDLDPSFGNGGKVVTPIGNSSAFARAVAIQPAGKIVAAGGNGYGISTYDFALVRYLSDPQSSFTVTRSDDRNNATCAVGDCSLREAVNAANASATDDTINFASGLTTITLTNEIVINNAGTLSINGTGANNLTIDGGAGTNRIFYTNNVTVTISGVTLTGGNGTGATGANYGGAVSSEGGSSLTLDGVHVTGNTASNGGGGVYYFGGTHRIINSTFSSNTAQGCGGGIAEYLSTLTIVNSTISGNTARYGGGLCTFDNNDIKLRNVTVTNNTAEIGGGISAGYDGGGSLNVGNTIVAGNTATTGFAPEIDADGSFISAGGNLIGPFEKPLLGALQNNGGTTLTHALLSGSPAIDKGLNSLAVDPLNNSILQTDQRGFARIFGSSVDIGAFESGSTKSRKRIRFF